MATFSRSVTVDWAGSIMEGKGQAKAGSGAFTLPVTFPSRIGEPDGQTSPEELIAAAHASCYAMALNATVGRKGGSIANTHVTATVFADKGDAGIKLTTSKLKVVVEGLQGIEKSQFAEVAKEAEGKCPISNALRGSLQIELENYRELNGSKGSKGFMRFRGSRCHSLNPEPSEPLEPLEPLFSNCDWRFEREAHAGFGGDDRRIAACGEHDAGAGTAAHTSADRGTLAAAGNRADRGADSRRDRRSSSRPSSWSTSPRVVLRRRELGTVRPSASVSDSSVTAIDATPFTRAPGSASTTTPSTRAPFSAITQSPSTMGSASVAANFSPDWVVFVDSVVVVIHGDRPFRVERVGATWCRRRRRRR